MVSMAARAQTTLLMSSGGRVLCRGTRMSGSSSLRVSPEPFVWELKVALAMDSSAARGAAPLVGPGRPRTMELKMLRLQKDVEDARVRFASAPGSRNVADVGVKSLAADRVRMLASMAGLVMKKKEVFVCVRVVGLEPPLSRIAAEQVWVWGVGRSWRPITCRRCAQESMCRRGTHESMCRLCAHEKMHSPLRKETQACGIRAGGHPRGSLWPTYEAILGLEPAPIGGARRQFVTITCVGV